MKKLFVFAFAVAMAVCAVFATACNDSDTNEYPEIDCVITEAYRIYEHFDSCSVSGGDTKAITEIVILSEYKGKPVDTIDSYAFYNYVNLKSVILPDTIRYIGNDAFSDCESLESINIPDGVISIGSSAFFGCSSLINVDIPDSVEFIGDSAFEFSGAVTSVKSEDGAQYVGNWLVGCDVNAETISVKEGTVGIAQYAFGSCYLLKSVSFPNSMKYFNAPVFLSLIRGLDCGELENLTVAQDNPVYHSVDNCIIKTSERTLVAGCKAGVIPDDGSVTAIGDFAFSRCVGLTSIDIPEGISSIGDYAFSACSSLMSVNLPQSLTKLGDYAFYECTSLTDIRFAGGMEIGIFAFSGCSALRTVELTEGIAYIPDLCFFNCSSLERTVIPVTVTSIGERAFGGTFSEIYFSGTCSQWNEIALGVGWYNGAAEVVHGVDGDTELIRVEAPDVEIPGCIG